MPKYRVRLDARLLKSTKRPFLFLFYYTNCMSVLLFALSMFFPAVRIDMTLYDSSQSSSILLFNKVQCVFESKVKVVQDESIMSRQMRHESVLFWWTSNTVKFPLSTDENVIRMLHSFLTASCADRDC